MVITPPDSPGRVWATFVSAPFTLLAKRKERLHGYNALSAKWKRAANMEARRRSKVCGSINSSGSPATNYQEC